MKGLVVAALFASACGRAPLGDGAGGSSGSAGTTGAGGASSDPCASPTACNDDPKSTAIAGTCTVVPADPAYSDVPSRQCSCAEGFSLNTKTLLCRAGSACVAAAADEWDYKAVFDSSDCAARAPTACDAPPGAQGNVGAELLALPGPKCTLPENLTIRIEVVDGCPTVLEGRGPASNGTLNSYYAGYLQCLEAAVGGIRLACGSATDCFMAEWSLIR